MKLSRLMLFSAIGLCALGQGAESPAQNHPTPSQRRAPPPEDVRVLSDYAQCVARLQAGSARALLAMDYRTEAYQRALRRLAEDSGTDCGPAGSLRFGGVLFTGGLAERLLRDGFQPGDLASHVALDPSRPPVAARDEVELMDICVVRAAPNEVAALLRTVPETPAETAALRAIAPHLAPCLREGVSLNQNRMMLRASLALAAYRLSDYNGFAIADARGAGTSSAHDRRPGAGGEPGR